MAAILRPLEQRLHSRVAGAAGAAQFRPGAVLRILVGAEADQLRAVPAAVALRLVVAHFGDEFGAERRLLELAGAPAVGLGEAALALLVEERADERSDLVVVARADRGGADIVGPAVVAVEPEQEGREPFRPVLPADADDDAVSGLVLLHLHDALAGAGKVRQAEPLLDDAVQPGRLEAVEPAGRRVELERRRRDPEPLAEAEQLVPPLLEWQLVHRGVLPKEQVERD